MTRIRIPYVNKVPVHCRAGASSLEVAGGDSKGQTHTLITVKTWCRNTMTEERLDAVAMGHVNHERSSSAQEILEVWDCSGHRGVAVAFNE